MQNEKSKIQKIKEKQVIRRNLLAKQLGVESSSHLKKALGRPVGDSEQIFRVKSIDTKKVIKPESKQVKKIEKKPSSSDNIIEVYKDSSTFLKGTQSLNPHNDYCQNYVDTGQRPQNFIRDVGLAERFGEYPKLKDLIRLKDEVIRKTNTPPYYLQADMRNFKLRDLGTRFDVILIEPPLIEYKKAAGLPITDQDYSWDDIAKLDIEAVAGTRSFLFLWCGSSDGLDHARSCLKKWNYRRCEDICWIKTNLKRAAPTLFEDSLLVRSKEHCLMGIKGTVRRSTDGDFIHANVDIDLIIAEECEPGRDDKPEEIFHIIEHFCLGRRRLHIFGKDVSIRPGWVTVGPRITTSNYDKTKYGNHFQASEENPFPTLTGSSDDIERLRPKTPPPRDKKMMNSGTSGLNNSNNANSGAGNRKTSQTNSNSGGRGATAASSNQDFLAVRRTSDHRGSATPPVALRGGSRSGSVDSRSSGGGGHHQHRKRDNSWDKRTGGSGGGVRRHDGRTQHGYRASRGTSPDFRT